MNGRSDELPLGQAPLRLVTVGDPCLLRENQPVTEQNWYEAVELSELMVHKLRALYGQGLAAPQVGANLCVAVVETRPNQSRPEAPTSELYVLFNPIITRHSAEQLDDWESCFSFFPRRLFGRVPRFSSVTVEYLDLTGEKRQVEADGLLARAMQHEIDHLDGLLYVDRMPFEKHRAARLFSTDENLGVARAHT
jgi:peptide deformylase